MQDRRRFLGGLAALLGGGSVASAAGRIDEIGTLSSTAMRGSIDAVDFGVYPAALDDQSKAFARMLQTAAERNLPISLPPGDYVVSNITLPRHVRLFGVPGASRIVYGGDGHLFVAEDAEHVELNGLVLDGANRWMGDHVQAILDARRVSHLVVDNCVLNGSGKSAISLERVSGRIERSHISGAADVAIYSAEAGQLQIVGNVVADCGNGGILVHRWQPGEDGTIVTGNRVLRIHARRGGTGQYGNGINIFRGDGVVVSGNIVSDCAFSAIRANSASNVQIAGNRCSRSGETAIYSEFAFEGAVITSNIVDGAANGISVVNFNEGGRMAVCSNNLVRNLSTEGPYPGDPPGFGIGICVEADAAATGNVIESAPTYGMLLGWGPFLRNVAATGNIIRQSPTGIAVSVVEGAGSAVIAGNVITQAERGAVVGHRWADPVTGDLARIGDAGFAHLTVERNRVS